MRERTTDRQRWTMNTVHGNERKRNEGKKKTWNEEVSKRVRDGGCGDIDRSAVAS
jgi:hypothetical protein